MSDESEDPDTESEISSPEPAAKPAPLLTFEESRVLGCLLEKEATTPDQYPLSFKTVWVIQVVF